MLPVLDLDGADADRDAFRASLRAVAHDYGFFYLTGHGVLPELTDEVLRLARRFFALPAAAKDEISQLQDGEILVAPLTAPSWAPVFGKIKATVTDVGGMMSHAAIVCREYGMPAVTGTGTASVDIVTGQMLRVDGTSGTVTILD